MGDCHCTDGDPDLTASEANYAAASVVSTNVYPAPLIGESAQVRRCEHCQAVWWVRLREHFQINVDREGEPTGGSRHIVNTNGLRCRDLAEAEALTPWYPQLREADRNFERAIDEHTQKLGPRQAEAAIAAHAVFAALLAQHPGAGQLLRHPE